MYNNYVIRVDLDILVVDGDESERIGGFSVGIDLPFESIEDAEAMQHGITEEELGQKMLYDVADIFINKMGMPKEMLEHITLRLNSKISSC